MEKKEYITNQLKKTFGKKYENYCITRIIHLVNRTDIKFITQQLFKRKGNNIALADLYFPQINLWVEIDEEHHEKQEYEDGIRTKEVIEIDKLIRSKLKNIEEVVFSELETPYRIIIKNKTIEQINEQIDEIVREVNKRINDLGENFIPWIEVNNNPEYYIKKGYISNKENAKFDTIDEIGRLFNMKVPFNQKMHGFVNIKENYYFWCPNLKLMGDECVNIACDNEISEDGLYIFESKKENNEQFVNNEKLKSEVRYAFVKYKDETGTKIYKFKGVYQLDINRTEEIQKRVWKKIRDEININEYFHNQII